MNSRTAILSGVCVLCATAQTTSQAPQRTIPAPQNANAESTAGEQAQRPGNSTSPFADAYRKQWERMSESERKTVLEMGGFAPEQAGTAFTQRTASPPRTGPLTPASGGQIPAGEGGTGGASVLQKLDRSLTDLDAIRDKYIDRAGGGKCPPAIMSRIADLKWKLGERGVVVASPRANAAPSDFVAIGQDWFKAGDAPELEIRQASIEDILPAVLLSSQRKQSSARDEEDVKKMQSEYEALFAACSGPQQPASRPGREQ